ncbi:LPXTG cell wall anchor domain-containing protein [Paenibacillus piri]|uniref:LPXTG cell wall anchor domain-containing protein n=1 Tax=Paenibacillus piri TaxID=2547395 RepID=A0A4R5KZG3_9BACL|nr:LPXTG cell wall anchor domain-containing protein [Paenibacillus piri]TDG00568.1 LPXTG cell wall anchor domain-containing protein [Paenibacillus piri]
MKKNVSKRMRKPAFWVMGSTLALLSLTAPALADNVGTSVYAVDSQTKSNTGSSTASAAIQTAATSVDISAISDAEDAGKRIISFSVSNLKDATDIDFFSYRKTATGTALYSKATGTYTSGQYSIAIELPPKPEEYVLEASYKRPDNSRVVIATRASSDKEWKLAKNAAVGGSEKTVRGDKVLTDVASTDAAGKATVTFQVSEGKTPVDLDVIVYKKTDNGRTIYTKKNGSYNAGKQSVEVDLPKNNDLYSLEIVQNTAKDVSIVLWGKESGGAWKPVNGSSAELSAVVMKKLNVTLVPTDKTTNTWSWIAENTSDSVVNLNWRIEGTDLGGSNKIQPGEKVTLAENHGEAQHMVVSEHQGYEIIGSSGTSGSKTPGSSNGNGTGSGTGSGGSGSGTGGSGSGSGSGSGTNGSGSGSDSGSGTGGSGSGSGSGTNGSGSGSGSGSGTGGSGSGSGSGTGGSGSAGSGSGAPAPTVPAGGDGTGGIKAGGVPVLSKPSDADLSVLPKTGEKAPYGMYAAGALLTLAGSLLLRRKGRS